MQPKSANHILKAFSKRAEEKIFKPGELLASKDFLSSHVFLIIEGTARLLSVTGTKESSIHRLSSGDLVGACSFLQGISIEHVRAASDLKVLSLPDHKFLELLIKDSEFRNIFLSELFPAEVLQIAQLADLQETANNFDLKDCFQKLGKLSLIHI